MRRSGGLRRIYALNAEEIYPSFLASDLVFGATEEPHLTDLQSTIGRIADHRSILMIVGIFLSQRSILFLSL